MGLFVPVLVAVFDCIFLFFSDRNRYIFPESADRRNTAKNDAPDREHGDGDGGLDRDRDRDEGLRRDTDGDRDDGRVRDTVRIRRL